MLCSLPSSSLNVLLLILKENFNKNFKILSRNFSRCYLKLVLFIFNFLYLENLETINQVRRSIELDLHTSKISTCPYAFYNICINIQKFSHSDTLLVPVNTGHRQYSLKSYIFIFLVRHREDI